MSVETKKIQCVILAGGLAKRMRPMTEQVPKALLSVLGKPFVDHQLRWLSRHGVTDIVLSIGYLGEKIRAYVEDGNRWGLQVTYVDEGKNLRGTGGALRYAVKKGVLHEQFIVTYGDSFLPVDFAHIFSTFQERHAEALMVVFKNEGRWDTSNVLFQNGKIELYDKHHPIQDKISRLEYIDYGLMCFQRKLIEKEMPEKHDLADFLHDLSVSGRLVGYEVNQRFYEIGSPSGLSDLEKFIATLS